jgi:NAD(P)-dependent dehydrogenase (short-subunit alcohol dehydrogenase family)
LHTWKGPEDWQARYTHGQADVTDEASVQKVVKQGVEKLGELSGVVCCAGILHGERVLGRESLASLDAFRKVIEVNVVGTFNVVRFGAESIARTSPQGPDQERGVIIMTSSIAALDLHRQGAPGASILREIAQSYATRWSSRPSFSYTWLGPLLLVFVAKMVFFLVLALFMPLISLLTALSG